MNSHQRLPRDISRNACAKTLPLPSLQVEAEGARRAFLAALTFRVRMLATFLRLSRPAERRRALARWKTAIGAVLRRVRGARRHWGVVRRHVALRVWVKRWMAGRAGRGMREHKTTTYKEARKYERKPSGERAKTGRKVQRRANGADVGIVMIWRLEGKLPMTELRPRRRRTEGDG